MKRRPLILAFALLLAVSAALIGVDYRLNHPSLTNADREFRALVEGADRVEIKTSICPNATCAKFSRQEYRTLGAEQTRELVELIRLIERTPAQFSRVQGTVSVSILEFHRQKKKLMPGFSLVTFTSWSEFHSASSPRAIHPRFEKPLREFLDKVAPERIQS